MTRRNQSATAEDAPQDVRARVDEQIESLTGEQESSAQERQEEQEHQPPQDSRQMHSLHASAQSDREAREIHRALSLMQDNISSIFDKMEARDKKDEERSKAHEKIMQEVKVTCDLMQQVIGRHDEQTENLGMQTAALARAETRLNELHQTLREHLSKHQHQ